jgi:molybdopterin converting factor subunit 1
MEIRLRYYALLRDITGCSEETVSVPDGSDGNRLLAAVAARYPDAQDLVRVIRLASDTEYLTREDVLVPGSTVQLIPPVSGG